MGSEMRFLFWVCAALVGYTYFGYPLVLYLRTLWRICPSQFAAIFPKISIIICIYNEGPAIREKLHNIAQLHYPRARREVIVVSDGSTDDTGAVLTREKALVNKILVLPEHRGKACALNQAIAAATGEILVFTDARQTIEPDAVRMLVANFADPIVGCVSGDLALRPCSSRTKGFGLYWTVEKCIRRWEASVGSCVGVTGSLYAVRKSMIGPLPPETILDDVYVPFQVARAGGRIVFESRARAWDSLSPRIRSEFRRKVRTLTGNYQLLRLAPWIITTRNSLRFAFVSHKLARLLVPFAMAGALVSSALMQTRFFEAMLALQITFYMLPLLSIWQAAPRVLIGVADAVIAFLVLNCAATVAFGNFVRGKAPAWR
jgi:biofilm PGA synthesis N-glycosyltransferase PgaC